MEWDGIIGKVQRTTQGTTRASLYYYTIHSGKGSYVAGRSMFGQDIDYRVDFTSRKQAQEFCQEKDRAASVWNGSDFVTA